MFDLFFPRRPFLTSVDVMRSGCYFPFPLIVSHFTVSFCVVLHLLSFSLAPLPCSSLCVQPVSLHDLTDPLFNHNPSP